MQNDLSVKRGNVDEEPRRARFGLGYRIPSWGVAWAESCPRYEAVD
ncbi:MAG: hypothetical protein HN736_09475 [Anaerolineae bacterium]|nr:hypothetical protein [Anaerolineae bacterium]MBT7774927.1 hypothetical protein [Anaerolineae bacterium]